MTELLQNIFQGNPLSTFIGKKIEAATRPDLESDDWQLNMEICDTINENFDDAKDAVRAIRKRLQQIENDPNFIITNRTLTVLETCVSNCTRRFHTLVMTKDFIQDLVKLIGPKNNPPIALQERVLRMIERWAEAFRLFPDLNGVVTVYNDLKSKGVTFPERDPTSQVPIQTPERSVPLSPSPQSQTPPIPAGARQQPTSQIPQQVSVSPVPGHTFLPAAQPGYAVMAVGPFQHPIQPPPVVMPEPPTGQCAAPAGPVLLEGEGHNKIVQDLQVVQSNVDVFTEVLRELEKGSRDADWQLAAELNITCRQMKERIVELIERVANEDLTVDLLRLNDELINIFTRYDRLVASRAQGQPVLAVSPTAGGPPESRAAPTLSATRIITTPATDEQQTAIKRPEPQSSATRASGAGPSTTDLLMRQLAVSGQSADEPSLIDLSAFDEPSPATLTPSTIPAPPVPTPAQQQPGQPIDPFDSSLVAEALSRLNSDTNNKDRNGAANANGTASGAETSSSSPPKASPTRLLPAADSLSGDLGRLNLGATNSRQDSHAKKDSEGEPKESSPPRATAAPRLPEEVSSIREQDFAEIENWLSTTNRKPTSDPKGESK